MNLNMEDFSPEKIPQQQELNRNPDGRFPKGVSGNPGGRPKGSISLKRFAEKMLREMPDDEKTEFLKKLPPEIVWKMAEGNPKQDTSVDLDANVHGPGIFRIDE